MGPLSGGVQSRQGPRRDAGEGQAEKKMTFLVKGRVWVTPLR